MSFADAARKARAISDQSRLRSEAAKLDQQWREVLENVNYLQAELAEVKQRLTRLESQNGQSQGEATHL
jgi:hypothetical protein